MGKTNKQTKKHTQKKFKLECYAQQDCYLKLNER